MTLDFRVGRLRFRFAEAAASGVPDAGDRQRKVVADVRPDERAGPRRHARLCADTPHRWWPLGHFGQLCLRCSLYRRDRAAPERGQGAGGREG